ncbi:hypothetical protein X777_15985 [Ooceraea biroi]|uniref:Uncharacterized protein n=1 Tax=Ooceraea biroi TaxID=2015173 RepID=A0A026WW53_OOCBI|nr:hypothetical protein X777_15985 [Ooceraea biroi]
MPRIPRYVGTVRFCSLRCAERVGSLPRFALVESRYRSRTRVVELDRFALEEIGSSIARIADTLEPSFLVSMRTSDLVTRILDRLSRALIENSYISVVCAAHSPVQQENSQRRLEWKRDPITSFSDHFVTQA